MVDNHKYIKSIPLLVDMLAIILNKWDMTETELARISEEYSIFNNVCEYTGCCLFRGEEQSVIDLENSLEEQGVHIRFKDDTKRINKEVLKYTIERLCVQYNIPCYEALHKLLKSHNFNMIYSDINKKEFLKLVREEIKDEKIN